MENNISYWERTSFFKYDVIIVGSGIVGLNAAIHLKKNIPNLNIAILERGFLPAGASTKNAGFACFGSVSELIEQEKTATTDGLKVMIEKRWKGLLKLRALLGDKTIDYRPLGGYELFKSAKDEFAKSCVSKIEHFNNLVGDIVGKNAFSLSNNKIDLFGFEGINNIISNQYEAQLDSGKMMIALIKYAQCLGIMIFNNCNVNAIEQESRNNLLITPHGIIKCKKLIVSTNAFIKSLIPNIDLLPGRGQVLITKPIAGLKINGTFHYDKGYYYFRNVADRILLGGGRNIDFKAEETTEFGETEVVQNALEELLKKVILPNQKFEIDIRWSGIMAFGKQLEPLIAQASENIFYATRCNGMGIAIGSQTGEDVAEMLIQAGI
ncbi:MULTISPECIES: FAD-binding oxidoreductase [Pedobacter]|uniref:NAD(P)/FAD-dependent oxidoreductase n=1 Tax=Pedobacter TaxID=84567 RepID=UPI001E3BF3D3|nr:MULTISPECIES: FAD-binding oxidoreductase [Pedobacter]